MSALNKISTWRKSTMLLEKTVHAKKEIHFKQTLMFPLTEFNSMLLHM
ncbi:hypothetical protein T09_11640 [Trichinella sp. T9]|nr:hypothetical protein T09_11640 [Trichinella sp. T9]